MAQKSKARQITRPIKNPAFEVVLNHVKALTSKNRKSQYGIDDIDMTIIQNMLADYTNSEIARMIRKPLSTVQRRTKKLVDGGYIHPLYRLDFRKFGLRRGMLFFKCKSANLKEAVSQISQIRGVESAGAYLGSLDVVAHVVYADSSEVLEIIGKAQALNLISDVTWSEEIHSLPL